MEARRDMAHGFYSRLAELVHRRRWTVLAIYCLLSVALGWLGSGITLKADLTDLLPRGTASGDDLRFFLEHFGTTDAFFFTLTGAEDDDVEALDEAAALLKRELEATGMFGSVRYGFSEEEGIEIARRALAHLPVLVPQDDAGRLRAQVAPEAIRAALAGLKTRAASPMMAGPLKTLAAEDPLGLLALIPMPGAGASGGPVRIDPGSGLLLSADGRSLLVISAPLRPPLDTEFSRRLLAASEQIEAKVTAAHPGIAIDHAGGYLFSVQDEARIHHDIAWTVSISGGAILLLFALVLRRVGLLLILMVPLCLSTLWTLGMATIYPGHLNIVTVAFAAILLGMGDDSLTHLYLRFREEGREGTTRAEALRGALISTGPSIVVATLTSGLAFAALTFVKFRGLSELGIIAAIGLLNLLVSCLFLFPALLSLGPERISAREARSSLVVPMGLFIRFHRWAGRRRTLVMTMTGALAIGAALACTRLEFSSDLKALRGDDPAQERMQRVLAPFGGMPDPIYLVSDAVHLEETLRSTEKLAPVCEALRKEGLIAAFDAPTTWIASQATQKARFDLGSRINWADVARVARARMEELGMNAGFFAPFFAHLDTYASWEKVRIEPDALAGTGPGLSGNVAAISLYPAAGVAPSRIVARARQLSGTDLSFRAASIGLVLGDLTAIIQSDFRRVSLLALVAVLVTAIVAFRTPARLFLVGLPVGIGCLVMLGGLALLGIPINLMNLVATPLVFGLGINFGVYIVNRHEEEGRADVEKVLRYTGGAMFLTGLTTLSGFGSLVVAQFAGLRSMGWVAVLGIGGCLLSALLVLPLLLPGPPAGPTPSASGKPE
jgi:hypothetical protein